VSKCAFKVIVFDFMKAIHVQLSNKTVHLIVSEIFWKHYFLKFDHIFNHKLIFTRCPVYYFLILLDLNQAMRTPKI